MKPNIANHQNYYQIFAHLFHLGEFRISSYLEENSQIIMPSKSTAMPMPMSVEPLTVQLGLAYINEDYGPITDLLCAVKIIPRMMDIRPVTVITLPMLLFISVRISFIGEKKNFLQASKLVIRDLKTTPDWILKKIPKIYRKNFDRLNLAFSKRDVVRK